MAQVFRVRSVARDTCAYLSASIIALGVGALVVGVTSAGDYSASAVMAPNLGLSVLVGLTLGLTTGLIPRLRSSLLHSLGLALGLTLATALGWFLITSWSGSELLLFAPLLTLLTAWISLASVLLCRVIRSTLVLGLLGLVSLGVLAIG